MSLAVPVAPIASHQLLIFLLQVGLLLLSALLLGRLATRVGMPAVVGELCVGVLLGPSLLENIAPGFSAWLLPNQPSQFHLLDAVGQIGVILLVGITGLEIDLASVLRRGGAAIRISVAGFLIPLGLGVAIGFLIPAALLTEHGDRTVFVLFLGVAMSVTAIPVIAKTLMDMQLTHRNVAQLTLAAGILDDVFGWVMLSIVSAMATTGLRAGHVVISLMYLAVVVLFSVTIGRPLVRAALRVAARSPDSGPTIATVGVMVFLGAAATHAMGLEAVFGAFVCGILIRASGAVDLARLAPLRKLVLCFFAPLFFATAGLRMDLTALREPLVLGIALAVLAVAVAGKFAGAYVGATTSRLNHWEALAIGAGMNSRGVIQVIIAMVGLRLGVLSTEVYTIIILVAIATSLMTAPILRFAMRHIDQTAEEQLRREHTMAGST